MDVKVIQLVLRTENILGIYRNYLFFPRKIKILTNIRVIIEIVLMITSVILSFDVVPRARTITFYITVGNSLIILLSARWHAASVKKMLRYMDENHARCSIHDFYLKTMESKYKKVKVVCIGYSLYGVCLFICSRLEEGFAHIDILFYFNLILCNARYIIEYVVIYGFFVVLTEQIKCVRKCIEEKMKVLAIEDEGITIEEQNFTTYIDIFKRWTSTYTNVKESSNLFNSVFGVQITVIIVSAMQYFIIFLYNVAFISVSGGYGSVSTLVFYSLKLFMYIVALFMLSRGAYNLQQSAESLKRQIVKLLIYCPIKHSAHRATKDLLRLVSTRTIRTRSFGSLPIDMTLLPSSVMFFTSYTVICL